MTATSVTSLCATPPAVLLCVNRAAGFYSAISGSAFFAVNLLHRSQAEISQAFGGRLEPKERFSRGMWEYTPDGMPYLVDAQAALFCQNEGVSFNYGTHGVFVGRVLRVRIAGELAPLIYQDGKYLSATH